MGTVAKALNLLALFHEDRLTLSLTEIAQLAQLDKATAHRLLRSLRDGGMIEQFGTNKLYRLGPEVLRLANVRERAVPLTGKAKQVLERLSEKVGETTHLSLRRATRMVSVAHHYSAEHAMHIRLGVESSHPFHATSSGQAVLAYCSPSFIESILGKELERFTPETQTDPELVAKALEAIRQQGFAESIGAFEADVHSFSAAIFDRNREPIGALSIAAPTSRVSEEERAMYPKFVMDAAHTLTIETGGLLPAHHPGTAAA